MIPDEAIAAAANAFAEHGTLLPALEAAAPHILAPLVADLDKWAGRSRTGFYDEAQDDVVQILNPYRRKS